MLVEIPGRITGVCRECEEPVEFAAKFLREEYVCSKCAANYDTSRILDYLRKIAPDLKELGSLSELDATATRVRMRWEEDKTELGVETILQYIRDIQDRLERFGLRYEFDFEYGPEE